MIGKSWTWRESIWRVLYPGWIAAGLVEFDMTTITVVLIFNEGFVFLTRTCTDHFQFSLFFQSQNFSWKVSECLKTQVQGTLSRLFWGLTAGEILTTSPGVWHRPSHPFYKSHFHNVEQHVGLLEQSGEQETCCYYKCGNNNAALSACQIHSLTFVD